MSQETLDIVKDIDWKDIEMQIAFYCAPLIAGLKLSNLLMLRNGDLDRATDLLKRAGISYFVVAVTNGKVAVLLFDRHRLETYLWEEKVWQIFRDMGYQDHAMGKILYAFRQRYEGYLLRNQEFPHEMGLLLGYPVEDVKGFIHNGGENCLYIGYWKVYENLTEKMVLFRQFEKARDMLMGLLSNGITIVEVVQKRLLVHSA